jgi:hypothetical protein
MFLQRHDESGPGPSQEEKPARTAKPPALVIARSARDRSAEIADREGNCRVILPPRNYVLGVAGRAQRASPRGTPAVHD